MANNAFKYYLLRRMMGGGNHPAIAAMKERVDSDNGFVEAVRCAQQLINGLGLADDGRILFDAFDLRVTTDSGITESRTCIIDTINLLRS